MVEVAFAAPNPLPGGAAAAPLLSGGAPAGGGPIRTASADPFADLGGPAAPIVRGSSSGRDGGWAEDGLRDPTTADRFAARGADAVAADRRRLEELDRRLDRLLDADPQNWDLRELEADLRDLRDRASSNAVRRLAQARLVRVDVLKTVRGQYQDYVNLTARTDKRDAVLTAEAAETLKRFAEVEQPYGNAYGPQTAEGFPGDAPPSRMATAPDGYGVYDDVPSLAAPMAEGIDQMSHTAPAGPTGPAAGPAGSVAFEAVGTLREVTNPPHPQAPRFALVGADGRVTAYLQEDPRLAKLVGQSFGVNGRRFKHPEIPAPMIAVQRMVPVRP